MAEKKGKPEIKEGCQNTLCPQYLYNAPKNRLGVLHRRLPARPKMAQRPQRQKMEFGDILRYQKIIVALSETHRLMKEIDEWSLWNKRTAKSPAALVQLFHVISRSRF